MKPSPPSKPASANANRSKASAMAWALLLLLAGLFALATHWPTLKSTALPFDTSAGVTNNPVLTGSVWTGIKNSLADTRHPDGPKDLYPLATLSYGMDRLCGGSPVRLVPVHSVSLAIHLASGLLLAFISYLLFKQRGLAVLLALLFTIHPISVELIAAVTSRGVLLATFFGLMSLAAYILAASRRHWPWYLLSLAAYGASLLSGTVAIGLPLGLLALDICPQKRFSFGRLAALLPYALAGALAVFAAWKVGPASIGPTVLADGGPFRLIGAGAYGAVTSLLRFAWPTDLSPHLEIPPGLPFNAPSVTLSLGGFIIATIIFIVVARRSSGVLLSTWVLYSATVIPAYLLLAGPEIVFRDSAIYFAALAWLVPLTHYLGHLWRKPVPSLLPSMRQCMLTIGGLYLAGFAARETQAYARHWRGTVPLYQHMVSLEPSSLALRRRLARAEMPIAPPRPAVTLESVTQAVAKDPDNVTLRNQLAELLMSRGRSAEALPHLEHALLVGATDARTLLNVGRVRTFQGDHEAALRPLEQALEQEPTSVDINVTLANALRELNRYDEAIERYQAALKSDPHHLVARRFLAFTLAHSNRREEAIEQYREIVRQQPGDAETHANLGILLNRTGESDEALPHLRQAVKLAPDNASYIYALGYALENKGELEEAIECYTQALARSPSHRSAKIRLELAQAKLNSVEDGGESAEAATDEMEPPSDDEAPASETIRLDFVDTPLSVVLGVFSDISGHDYRLEDVADMPITLQADEPVSLEEAKAQLEQALASQGLEAIASETDVVVRQTDR